MLDQVDGYDVAPVTLALAARTASEGWRCRSAVVATAIDEEGWGAGDSAEVGTVDVLGNAVGARMLAQLVGEVLDIEAELLRVADEIGWSERVLVVEQQVVHRPERPRAAAASAASAASWAWG